jgi:hypothetical protein
MEPEMIEKGLVGFHCLESGGLFIPSENYWRWLHQQPERLPQLPAPSDEEPMIHDSECAKICPESGALMQRYRIGHGFGFFIERSPTGSIWLDAGEWEALKKRQFHDEIHLVFTAPWQSEILNDEITRKETERLTARLGPELLSQLTTLRKKLKNHPERMLALSVLNQE